jgi:hypothetical protein
LAQGLAVIAVDSAWAAVFVGVTADIASAAKDQYVPAKSKPD